MSIVIGLRLAFGCCGINHTLCHACYMVLVSIIWTYFAYTSSTITGLDGEMWILSLILMRSTVCLISTTNLDTSVWLWVYLLYVLSVLFFCCRCWIIIYVVFELRLIPFIVVIIGRGIQCERIQARVYLVVYTIFLSIPILICVVYIASYGTNIKYVTSIWMSNTLAVLILSMPILVKRPVYLLHLWLPIAHVEAPSFGSVILASVTLKIGVYGVIRILIFWSYRHWAYIMYLWAILGVAGSSILCLIQSDVKAYIAFSSISHINLLLFRLWSFVVWCKIGGIIISIRHGFTRAYLFLWGGIIFHLYFTRNMVLVSCMCLSSTLGVVSIISVLSNFGVPFSLLTFNPHYRHIAFWNHNLIGVV